MAPTFLHLRSETKSLERRSALTPKTTKALVEAGYTVNVERSTARMFSDGEFATAGASLVPEGTWIHAPKDHIIVGLKELPHDEFPLIHQHIQFGHCYKGQEGWAGYLSRFAKGGGVLYDIEFLTDPSGKRVAAFGYHAGYAGAAVSLIAWAHQIQNPGVPCPSIPLCPSATALVRDTKAALAAAAVQNKGEYPTVMVIGALGRCGSGAVDFCRAAGVPDSNILKWDMAETARGGPFPEIAASDIFINCIYLTTLIPPFVTRESLSVPGRKLRVVCDVSCDPSDPNNPIPLYTECSTFTKPTLPVEGITGGGPELTVTAIDHLPSLVAREASDAFSTLLLPSLLTLEKRGEGGVWLRAERLFHEHVKKIPQHAVSPQGSSS